MNPRVLVTACLALTTAQPLAAQPADDGRVLEARDTQPSTGKCTDELPEGKGHYPFFVEEIAAARRVATPPPGARKTAEVVVIDNSLEGPDPVVFPKHFLSVPTQDTYQRPVTPEARAELIGHGTYVTGIVLGGRYDDGTDPDRADLAKPSVRRLLFRKMPQPGEAVPPDDDMAPSFRVWVMPLMEKDAVYGDRRIGKLKELLMAREQGPGVDVVNMSFIRHGRTMEDDSSGALAGLHDNLPEVLFVAAAGNSGEHLTRSSPARYPAMAQQDWKRNLLVVASHNADYKRSDFSNFGEDYVELAAPGCSIQSWLPGTTARGEALSGTSMAAPVVTFAAALLKSTWSSATARQLHDRLVHSSSYRDTLMSCKLGDGGGSVPCVRNGSALDIPTALLYTRDVLEYCDVELPPAGPCPKVERVLGALASMPEWVTAARGQVPDADPVARIHLSLGAALRRGPGGDLQHLYVQRTGPDQKSDVLKADLVTIKGHEKELLEFVREGPQLRRRDGSVVPDLKPASDSSDPAVTIQMWQLIRLVMRSTP